MAACFFIVIWLCGISSVFLCRGKGKRGKAKITKGEKI